VNVLNVNFDFDPRLTDPEQLLDRYTTLTGWSEALLEAGAARVVVQQAFHRPSTVVRSGIHYQFVSSSRDVHPELTDVDVAHVNGLGFPGRTRRLRARLPSSAAVLIQDHASGPPPGNVLSGVVRRLAFRSVDAFLFTAFEQATAWQEAAIIGRHQPIYELLEASTRLKPIARAAARLASGVDGSPAVLWVGRLNANKDPLTVIDGFERASAALPGAMLTMVFGSDELLTSVRRRVAASPTLERRVRLAGSVPQDGLPAYYSAADLFVLGSHHEGSGYALLEACACGAIPVVTSIPAFRVITGGGAFGSLWTPGDEQSLARALIATAGQDLDALRAAVALHFVKALSWPVVGRRAIEIYAEVRARRGRSR
jgi:glycosyltransferase involved in cell wall biosynthesis